MDESLCSAFCPSVLLRLVLPIRVCPCPCVHLSVRSSIRACIRLCVGVYFCLCLWSMPSKSAILLGAFVFLSVPPWLNASEWPDSAAKQLSSRGRFFYLVFFVSSEEQLITNSWVEKTQDQKHRGIDTKEKDAEIKTSRFAVIYWM